MASWTGFPWSVRLAEVLKDVFGLTSLRPLQRPATNATMAGRDVLLVLPTGGGKSLCYQLPAMLSKGITLVVSPLVSLMEDQMMSLEALNIPAAMLCAASSKEEVREAMAALAPPGKAPRPVPSDSTLRLLYVTPERIARSKLFMARLQKAYEIGRLDRIAIDEVHCCSQWGNDFRPDYKILEVLKRHFPKTPIIGLTGTASPQVINDVRGLLNLPNALLFKASFNRPNLNLQVRDKPRNVETCMDNMAALINGPFQGQTGIVYCLSRRDSDTVAHALCQRGVAAACYHADLSSTERSRVHHAWARPNGTVRVIAATVAFGMGIDRPDVRFVLHHSISKSLENYYQESGRAGRDHAPAHCVLFFSFADVFRQSGMVAMERSGQQKLSAMVAYCIAHRCRRQVMAEHFEEPWEHVHCDGMCDTCAGSSGLKEREVSSPAQTVLAVARQAVHQSVKLTPLKLLEGSIGHKPTRAQPRSSTLDSNSNPLLDRRAWENLILHLLLEGYLKEEYNFTPYSTITYLSPGFRASKLDDPDYKLHVWLPSLPDLANKQEKKGSKRKGHFSENYRSSKKGKDVAGDCTEIVIIP
uniref:ATP-dependent DNA helicase Q1-like isoform X2 n=1 Tax=Myxine glutinosa TaxID=7769 RepID=UPI00358E2651